MTPARFSAGVFAAALIASNPAQAGRPLQTEDAAVLERGACEVELVAARERAEATPTAEAGRAQFGCGIGLRSQFAVYGGRERGGGERTDLAGVVGKTWLRELTEDQTGFTLAWAAGYLRPRGGGFDRDGYEVRGVVTHPIGPWLLHANVGWLRDETGDSDATVWGAAVERLGVLGPLDAMIEVFGESGEKAWANAGLRWNALPGKLSVDGSVGRQMGRDGGTLITVGMKLEF